MTSFFEGIEPVAYEGPETNSELAFRHLRPRCGGDGQAARGIICVSPSPGGNSFAWTGATPFGGQTFERP